MECRKEYMSINLRKSESTLMKPASQNNVTPSSATVLSSRFYNIALINFLRVFGGGGGGGGVTPIYKPYR